MGIASVHVGDIISAVADNITTVKRITAIHVRDSFSNVGDSFSTVEVVQYSGG